MAGDRDSRRWTVLLLRDGGVRAASWSFGPTLGLGAIAAVLLLLLAVGWGGGLWWAGARTERRVRALEDRVERLRDDRARVSLLAARLDSIERNYLRLRRAMAAGSGDSAGTVRLPAVGAGGEPEAGRETAEGPRWEWPLARRGFVTRSFDAAGASGHPGLDVAVPSGSYVRASRPGVVEEAGTDAVYGRFVRLRHADGATSLYGHAQWLFVASGDRVEGGEVIALSGSTGRSSAPHLHFEVRDQAGPVDPTRLLREGPDGRGRLGPDGRGGGP